MAKKKSKSGSKTKKPEPAPARSSKNAWIIAAVAVAAVALFVIVSNGSSEEPAGTSTASTQEQDYLGRFLPAGYEEPKVGSLALYSNAVTMSRVTPVQDAAGISIPLEQVVSSKIVNFDYQRADGQRLPMLAYVKPSGALFVGIDYCPPCEGEGQRIEADGTLTCETCGTKRDLETNSGIGGACKLYPLDEVPSTIVGDDIQVDGAVLDAWTAQPLDRPIG